MFGWEGVSRCFCTRESTDYTDKCEATIYLFYFLALIHTQKCIFSPFQPHSAFVHACVIVGRYDRHCTHVYSGIANVANVSVEDAIQSGDAAIQLVEIVNGIIDEAVDTPRCVYSRFVELCVYIDNVIAAGSYMLLIKPPPSQTHSLSQSPKIERS